MRMAFPRKMVWSKEMATKVRDAVDEATGDGLMSFGDLVYRRNAAFEVLREYFTGTTEGDT